MNQGIYEELVTQLVNSKLSKLEQESFYIEKSRVDEKMRCLHSQCMFLHYCIILVGKEK